jgi:hypothetical protein
MAATMVDIPWAKQKGKLIAFVMVLYFDLAAAIIQYGLTMGWSLTAWNPVYILSSLAEFKTTYAFTSECEYFCSDERCVILSFRLPRRGRFLLLSVIYDRIYII